MSVIFGAALIGSAATASSSQPGFQHQWPPTLADFHSAQAAPAGIAMVVLQGSSDPSFQHQWPPTLAAVVVAERSSATDFLHCEPNCPPPPATSSVNVMAASVQREAAPAGIAMVVLQGSSDPSFQHQWPPTLAAVVVAERSSAADFLHCEPNCTPPAVAGSVNAAAGFQHEWPPSRVAMAASVGQAGRLMLA